MERRLIGSLKNGEGVPLYGAALEFVAAQSSPPFVPESSALLVELDESGSYDTTMLSGVYKVTLLPAGVRSRAGATLLGLIDVTAGPPIDLLTLIGAPDIDQSDVQHLIDEALSYIQQAEDARDAAQMAATGAEGWSELARDWAEKLGDEVAAGEGYSAKHHAAAAESSALAASGSASAASGSALAAAGSAGTASEKAGEASDAADLAKDWAEKLGSEVEPGEGYSAKHHADAAAGSALAASGSASAASGSALAASGSAGTAATKAGEASDSAALAQDWAEGVGEVEAGAYSAKHHAQAAAGSATQAAVNAAAVNTTYGAYIAQSTGDVFAGGYPASRSARESVTLDRFYAEVMAGAGSCKVAVYINNALSHGPVLIAAGSPVTQTGLTVAVPAGARMEMQVSEVSGVQALWAQIDGGPA